MPGARADVAAARRVVVKVGSTSVTTDGHVDVDRLAFLVGIVADASANRQVVLVSSGAIASGIRLLGLTARPRDLATAQAAASVGQGVLLAEYTRAFAAHDLTVGQVLLTADDLGRRAHHRNAARTLARLLDLSVVPIVNENDTVATDEIRLGDNDRLAALVAHLIAADLLLLLSDVDAVYDRAPHRPGARRIDVVAGPEDLVGVEVTRRGSPVGTGGMATKLEAARIATSGGVTTVVTDVEHAAAALAGAAVGTYFPVSARRPSTRLFWLAHLSTPQGRLDLDVGAVDALLGRRRSLLAAGVVATHGRYRAGDPVDLCGPDGAAVARGLIAFDSEEVPALLGRSTADLARDLGSQYERELVHRDDLAILRG